jgi:uncharacterized protein (DUF1919 family)
MWKKLKRSINRWRFKRSVGRLRDEEFCIVASNCVGSRIYQILGRPYNTPFVGLLLLPDCFSRLVADFEAYMAQELRFVTETKYEKMQKIREAGNHYPLAMLGDLELHFLHYESEEEAREKWTRRKARMDMANLHYILVVNDFCDEQIIARFTGDSPDNKVCFHSQESLDVPIGVYVPSKDPDIGNLYSQYQRFVGCFDFADWILGNDEGRRGE